MKTVLITGASGGIGYELAKLFARDGYRLVLVARRKEKLERVGHELEGQFKAKSVIIPIDLVDRTAPDQILEELKKRSLAVDILINNAGFGLGGPFLSTNLAKEVEMIQVNISALTALTKLLLPAMVTRGSGRILNLASTAAFQPGPLMAVYYATKAYVLSFSEALASELEGTGVTVTALCPGPTKTDFQARAELGNVRLFRRTMAAQQVAEIGYRGLLAGQRVVVPGLSNKIGTFLVRFLPRSLVLRAVKNIQTV